jgi:hypothetical protein
VKNAAAIGLITLLLFNLCGYRMVADWLQTCAEQRLETNIDQGSYNINQVIELSVVTNLPYTNDWKDWERCSGTIEVNGLHYQYVERKMEKGNMRYRCLPNAEKQNLMAARDEFFQLVNNFNNQSDSKKSSPSILINNFIGDYDDVQVLQLTVVPVTEVKSLTWSLCVSPLADVPGLSPSQPPEC